MKNHHISEAGVSFEIWFGLCIKIWAGEHIFYIWQQTIALNSKTSRDRNFRIVYLLNSAFRKTHVLQLKLC